MGLTVEPLIERAVTKMAPPRKTVAAKPAPTGSSAEAQPRRSPKHRTPQQSAGPRPKGKAPANPKQQKLPFSETARRRTEEFRRPSRIARMREEGTLTRMFKVGTAVTTLFLLFAGLWFTVRLFSRSRFFYLNGVEVHGNARIAQEDIERLVQDHVPEGVLRADLPLIRANLQKHELISEVEVGRLLPDRLRVTIKEREPYTLARRADGSVAAVDRNGVMFGDEKLFQGLTVPPLISGLAEGGADAAEANRQRLMLYQQLLAELEQQTPSLSARIEEVIFDENGDLGLVLEGSGVTVLVGREDFRARLNAALDVLEAVRRRDADALRVLSIPDAERLLSGARIVYVNATIPKRVIVGLAE
jgi:cell division septal protein FtsQ